MADANKTTPFVPFSFGAGLPTAQVPNEGYKLFITATVFVILAAIFVGLRLWTRVQKRNFGADDYCIVISLAFSIALTTLMDMAVASGYGVQAVYLTSKQKDEALKWFFVSQIVYKFEIMMTKTSLILLYLRIFISRGFRTACFAALAIVVAWSVGSIVSTICQCIPIEASWLGAAAVPNSVCINSDASWYQYGIINILTDVLIFALPVRQVLSLQLGRRERWGLLGVFLIGAFVCIVSICRVVVVANSTQLKKDQTGNFVPRSALTLVEANVGIICACLPMLRAPMAFFFARSVGASSKSRGPYELSGGNTNKQRSGLQGSKNATPSLSSTTGAAAKQGPITVTEDRLSEQSQEDLIGATAWSPGDGYSGKKGNITVTRDYEIRRA